MKIMNSEELQYILKTLNQLAELIVQTFGRNCEVAVHDLRNLDKSLTYIVGDVTKRKIGAPITDMAAMSLHEEGNDITDKYNYKTINDDGRSLKSSTAFIRDKSENVVAAFCINFDTTDYFNAIQALGVFSNSEKDQDSEPAIKETFAHTPTKTIKSIFEHTVSEFGKGSATMSTDEKINLVKSLERKGVFQIKGSVDQIAILLGVSKFTVYNYLQKIKAEKNITKSNS
jgi:predicted transcriptional regulator YheO